MAHHPEILNKDPGGWTLIVLLSVIAMIALLMVYYLPSVLQSYSPPTREDAEGTTKPVPDHVKDQLAPIDERSKQLEDYLSPRDGPEGNQPQDQDY